MIRLHAILLLVSMPIVCTAQDFVQTQSWSDAFIKIATPHLQRSAGHELARTKRLTKLDNRQLGELTEKIDAHIEEYASKLARKKVMSKTAVSNALVKKIEESMRWSLWLPNEVHTSFVNDLALMVNKKQLQKFNDDYELRREWAQRIGVDIVLSVLNARLLTSEDQERRIRKILVDNFQYAWVLDANMITYGDFRLFMTLPVEELHGVITHRQKATWNTECTIDAEPEAEAIQQGKDEQDFRERLKKAIDLKIECLNRELSLSDKQIDKLQLVAKGCIDKAVFARKADLDRVRRVGYRGQVNPNEDLAALQIDTWAETFAPPSQLLNSKGEWKRFVRGTLEDRQRTKYDKLEKARKTRWNNALAGWIVATNTMELSLDGSQLIQLHELMLSRSPFRPFSYAPTYSFFEISEAKFRDILSAEQWGTFQPQWSTVQGQLQKMNAQRSVRRRIENTEATK